MVKAHPARWAAQAIRDALPTEVDFAEAELFSERDRAAALQELERLANLHLAEALRLEAL